jgi:hypothetical protein
MPIELILSPIFRPIVMAKAVLFHVHRPTSRYIPKIVDLLADGEGVTTYTILREFGTGGKAYSVYSKDVTTTTYDQQLYKMVRSRAVKGAYKFYTKGYEEPTATLRAGLRSNVLLIRRENGDNFELGWHVVGHRVDHLDGYRMFQLADGRMYHWSTKGKFLERVTNAGEKESEVRERVAAVTINGNKGFTISMLESEVPRELAIATAMISYIDQWNTLLGVGGIYYSYQAPRLRWKRD